MKLYFYMFDRRGIECVNGEAEEKKNSYYLQENIAHVYKTRIKKSEIGQISSFGYYDPTLVLTEKDDEKAKEILSGYIQKKIENHEKEIERLKKTINVIQEWRNEL